MLVRVLGCMNATYRKEEAAVLMSTVETELVSVSTIQ